MQVFRAVKLKGNSSPYLIEVIELLHVKFGDHLDGALSYTTERMPGHWEIRDGSWTVMCLGVWAAV